MRKVLVKYPVVGAPGFQVVVVQSDAEEGCDYCRKPTRQAISWGRATPHGICLASSGKSICPQCQEKAAGEMAKRVLGIVGLLQRVEVFQGGLDVSRYHDLSLVNEGSTGSRSADVPVDDPEHDLDQSLTVSERFVRWLEERPFGCGM